MIFFKDVPKGSSDFNDRLLTSNIAAPKFALDFFGDLSFEPTIISAILFAVSSLGIQVPITLPRLSIVARSHRDLISSNLCEIYRIEVPSSLRRRNVKNKASTS